MYRDTVNCEAARETLWPLEQPRAYSDEDKAARMHIGHCADCREFFARDAAVVHAVSTYGAAARAPESLRKQIREAIGLPPRTLTALARRTFSSIGEFPAPTE